MSRRTTPIALSPTTSPGYAPATTASPRRSELYAVGPLQLFDPVVADGNAVILRELVILRCGAVLGQDRRQLLEIGFQPGRGEDLDHPGRGASGVPHGVRRVAGLDQVAARARGQFPVTHPDPH